MVTAVSLSFVEALDDACRRYPKRIAVESCGGVASEQSLTYEALDNGSRILASELLRVGVREDEPVIVFVSNLSGDLRSLLGVWRAGAAAVLVHRDCVAGTLRSILQRTGARVLVWGEVTPTVPLPDGTKTGTGPAQILVLDREAPSLRDTLRDAAVVVFTSGSTGEPKGVVLSRDAFIRKLAAINEVLRMPQGVRTLLVLQLGFTFGQWVSLLTLLQGGTLLVAPKFVASECLEILADKRIDHVALVPTMMRAMLSELRSDRGRDHLARLRAAGYPRLICAGGEPLAPALGKQFRELLPHTGIADVYGLTETCTSDFILRPDLFDRYSGSIGFPSPGVEFRITDPAHGDPVALGQTGELEIKTDFIMNGYLDAPELTRSAFRDGYFRTGDLARQSSDGAVYLAGRAKDLILRGGNKVSPIEVDATLIQHPEVEASLTAGVPDPLMGERIHTLVVLNSKSNLDTDTLRSWAFTRLDKFKVPDRIHIGSRIPQGRTGKDDRRALVQWLGDQGLLEPQASEEA